MLKIEKIGYILNTLNIRYLKVFPKLKRFEYCIYYYLIATGWY